VFAGVDVETKKQTEKMLACTGGALASGSSPGHAGSWRHVDQPADSTRIHPSRRFSAPLRPLSCSISPCDEWLDHPSRCGGAPRELHMNIDRQLRQTATCPKMPLEHTTKFSHVTKVDGTSSRPPLASGVGEQIARPLVGCKFLTNFRSREGTLVSLSRSPSARGAISCMTWQSFRTAPRFIFILRVPTPNEVSCCVGSALCISCGLLDALAY